MHSLWIFFFCELRLVLRHQQVQLGLQHGKQMCDACVGRQLLEQPVGGRQGVLLARREAGSARALEDGGPLDDGEKQLLDVERRLCVFQSAENTLCKGLRVSPPAHITYHVRARGRPYYKQEYREDNVMNLNN